MGLRFQRRGPDVAENHPSGRRWQHLVAAPQPARRVDGASDASAPKIDDEAILRQARKLCIQHGAVWDASELDQAARWERNKIIIDDAGRRKYLALAREELCKEESAQA